MGDDNDCPLCMERLDVTDQSFKPCPCGYQICLWCYHQINESLNGCCPACRRAYSHGAQAVDSKVIRAAQEEVRTQKVKKKQQRAMAKANRPSEGHGENGYFNYHPGEKQLSQVRVLQRNLVYVTGLPLAIAKEHTLKSTQFFGAFGRIGKLTVHRGKGSRDRDRDGRVTATAYVTYKHEKESNACILAMHGRSIDDGRTFLRCQFGTTKYCSFFLKQLPCNNPNCMYLHKLARKQDCTTKDALLTGLHGPNPPSQMMPMLDDEDEGHPHSRKNSASSGSTPPESDAETQAAPATAIAAAAAAATAADMAFRIATVSRPGPDGRNIRVETVVPVVPAPKPSGSSSPGPSPSPPNTAPPGPKGRRPDAEQGSLFTAFDPGAALRAQQQSMHPEPRPPRSQTIPTNGHPHHSPSRSSQRAPPPGFATAAPRRPIPVRNSGSAMDGASSSRKGLSRVADSVHDAGTWDFDKFFAGLGKSFGASLAPVTNGKCSRFAFASGHETRPSNDATDDLLRSLLASVDISIDFGRSSKPKGGNGTRGQRSEYDLFGARSRGSTGQHSSSRAHGQSHSRYGSQQQCAPQARGSGRTGPAYYSGYGPPPGLGLPHGSQYRESNRVDAFS